MFHREFELAGVVIGEDEGLNTRDSDYADSIRILCAIFGYATQRTIYTAHGHKLSFYKLVQDLI